MDELCWLTAIELRREIQKRNIGIEELTRSYLNRIEKYDQMLNTISEINESALKQARKLDSQKSERDSILFGLPLLIKDNIDVAGLHTTAGSMALSDNRAETNAAVVENIIHNGGIILGKTNMTEFANFTTQGMPNGYSSKGGIVKNAYDYNKDPGGSSTGSAVAVSAGFCSMAVGTDTSFSIVACAAENGIAGLKPQFASLSSKGIIPISSTLDSAGALSRDLSDAILLYSGMSDKPLAPIQPIPVNELEIGINLYNKEKVSNAQCQNYERLVDSLCGEGAQFFEITQPYSPYQHSIMQYEFKRDLEKYLSNSSANLKTLDDIIAFYEANPQTMMKYGISTLQEAAQKSVDDFIYKEAMAERVRMRSQVVNELEKYDACIMTGPTNIMHFVGLPSLALKLCMGEDEIPKGIIIYGADERRLLAAALTIETYCSPFCPPGL
ncbi:MAG: amidase [Lachnospiraceae bacterium]|nr:amidase [Lachnospiraceae bacterium]